MMTNREQALTTMFMALKSELELESGVFQENEDFNDESKVFLTALEYNLKCGTEAHASNSGYSTDKQTAKENLCESAANLSGKAYYKFRKLGKMNLAEQLHTEPTEYLYVSDSECANMAQTSLDLMKANLVDLGPKTVTADMLNELQKEIEHYKSVQGMSATVHGVSPALTKKYKDSFGPVLVSVENLKYLVRDFKGTNLAFYDRVMASTIVPTINIHHTTLSINALAKSNGAGVPKIVFSLATAKKSGTTDENGMAEIELIKAGMDTLTGVLEGKTVYSGPIHIKRGSANHTEVVIEGM